DGSFILNWTESQFAESYSVYRNNSLLIPDLPTSQTTYSISDMSTGTYEYFIQASNEFGNLSSNKITIEVDLYAISFMFEMEDSITLPADFANFRIELENINKNITSEYVVSVNLLLYRVGGVNVSILVPPVYYPLENSTFTQGAFTGVNFTLVNKTIYSGEGLIFSGLVSCSTPDILIRFKWILIVNDVVIPTSAEDFITVT
ncbi:hypothetical protein LCGC14_0954640, partial [marine sediment metagenome]